MRKQVVPKSQLSCPIVMEKMPENQRSVEYEKWELGAAIDLISRLRERRTAGERILVLSRYNDQLNLLKSEIPDHPNHGLDFMTIHRAKGKEADYVLLLGCVKGEYGFPSQIKEEKLLEIARNREEDGEDKLEEERRLFYVALTRCKKELHIFTSNHNKSQFISEISKYPTLDPFVPDLSKTTPTRRNKTMSH